MSYNVLKTIIHYIKLKLSFHMLSSLVKRHFFELIQCVINAITCLLHIKVQ